jgi:hypothetical protein
MPVILDTQEAEIRKTVVQSAQAKWFTRFYLKKKKKSPTKNLVRWFNAAVQLKWGAPTLALDVRGANDDMNSGLCWAAMA